jgi:hypothetical protein
MAWAHRYATTDAPGGGSGTLGDPWTVSEAFTNACANNYVWIKDNGDHLLSSGLTVGNSGVTSNNSQIVFKGYKNTINTSTLTSDMDFGQEFYGGALDAYRSYRGGVKDNSSADWVVIDANNGAFDIVTITDKDNIAFYNLAFVNNSEAAGLNGIELISNPANIHFQNCVFFDVREHIAGVPFGLFLIDCYFGDTSISTGIGAPFYGGKTYNCVIDGSGRTYGATQYQGTYEHTIFVNGNYGLLSTVAQGVINCIFYNQTIAALIVSGASAPDHIYGYNNIFFLADGVNDYAVTMTTTGGTVSFMDNCCAWSKTGPINVIGYHQKNSEEVDFGQNRHWVLEDPQFKDPSNLDFTPLNNKLYNSGFKGFNNFPSHIGAHFPNYTYPGGMLNTNVIPLAGPFPNKS